MINFMSIILDSKYLVRIVFIVRAINYEFIIIYSRTAIGIEIVFSRKGEKIGRDLNTEMQFCQCENIYFPITPTKL